jgi:hypothetical protein
MEAAVVARLLAHDATLSEVCVDIREICFSNAFAALRNTRAPIKKVEMLNTHTSGLDVMHLVLALRALETLVLRDCAFGSQEIGFFNFAVLHARAPLRVIEVHTTAGLEARIVEHIAAAAQQRNATLQRLSETIGREAAAQLRMYAWPLRIESVVF